MEKRVFPFFQFLEEHNTALAGAAGYVLYPGMEFGSREKWWPDSGMRPTCHEGVDICYYVDRLGVERRISPDTRVPVMAGGRVAALCRDFLGSSLFLDHQYEDPLRFCSVYAHIIPAEHISVGTMLQAGEVIGTIADTSGRKNRMPAHLHLTLMGLPRDIAAPQWDWNLITGSEHVRLFDPLLMLEAEKKRFSPGNQEKALGIWKSGGASGPGS